MNEPQTQPFPKRFRVIRLIVDEKATVPTPLVGTDATNKDYVDDEIASAIGDLIDKGEVDIATTAALAANTRTANVLKADAVGAFPTIDGIAAVLNNTYLVKNEGGGASHINNGLYTLTVLGDGSTEWELTRNSNLTDSDNAAGAFVHIQQGTTNTDATFRCINNSGSDVVNTDALEFLYWGQTVDHAYLKSLLWSIAGHTIDTAIAMATNKVTGMGDGTADQDATTVIQIPKLMAAITEEPTGFPDGVDDSVATLAFSDSGPDRTLTITPIGATFDFYVFGTKYTKTGAQSKQVSVTEGLHFIYYDSSGVLQETTTWNDNLITQNALVAIVYWDAINSAHIYMGDERHTDKMPGITHAYLHNILGAVWVSGMALGNFDMAGTGNNATEAQFSVSTG